MDNLPSSKREQPILLLVLTAIIYLPSARILIFMVEDLFTGHTYKSYLQNMQSLVITTIVAYCLFLPGLIIVHYNSYKIIFGNEYKYDLLIWNVIATLFSIVIALIFIGITTALATPSAF